MDSRSQFPRGASLFYILLFLLVPLLSTCVASPVNAPSVEQAKAKPEEVVVDADGEKTVTEETPKALLLDEGQENDDENVSEELTPGAVVSGELEKNDDDVGSAEAATFLVSRYAMQPRAMRSNSDELDDDTEDEAEIEVGQGRVGELGTIISVIKIATELGEAVLPVVIREVEATPIGSLVIGVIGGINDGASGAASGDTINAGMPVPIKVARRAVRGFLRAHSSLLGNSKGNK